MNKSFEIRNDSWICENYVRFTISSDKITKLDIDFIDLTNVKDVKTQIIKLDLLYKIYTKALDEHLSDCTQEECQQIKNIIFNSPIDLLGMNILYRYSNYHDYNDNSLYCDLKYIKTCGDAFKMFGHPDYEYEYIDGAMLILKEIDYDSIKEFTKQLICPKYNDMLKYTKLHNDLINIVLDKCNRYYIEYNFTR